LIEKVQHRQRPHHEISTLNSLIYPAHRQRQAWRAHGGENAQISGHGVGFPTKRCDRLPRSSKAAATPKDRFSARGFARAELAKRGYWHRTNCRGAGVI